jgi:hypothetical protein
MKKAIKDLNAFITEVNQDMKTGRLSSEQGSALIDSANSIIKVL